MSDGITAEQAKKLMQAVENAKGPGECRYVVEDGPGCVIGQLAAIEGVPLETLERWDTLTPYGRSETVDKLLAEHRVGTEKLTAYPSALLYQLQSAWDCDTAPRPKMRRLVTGWKRVEEEP